MPYNPLQQQEPTPADPLVGMDSDLQSLFKPTTIYPYDGVCAVTLENVLEADGGMTPHFNIPGALPERPFLAHCLLPSDMASMVCSEQDFLRLGDVRVPLKVESITVSENSDIDTVPILRNRGTMKRNAGHTSTRVDISARYTGLRDINGWTLDYNGTIIYDEPSNSYPILSGVFLEHGGLRPLIATFRRMPFIPVVNSLLNGKYKIDALAFASMQIATVEGAPETMMVMMTFYKFDYTAYLPEVEYYADVINWPLYQKYLYNGLCTPEEKALTSWDWKNDVCTVSYHMQYDLKPPVLLPIVKQERNSPLPVSMTGQVTFEIADEECLKQLRDGSALLAEARRSELRDKISRLNAELLLEQAKPKVFRVVYPPANKPNHVTNDANGGLAPSGSASDRSIPGRDPTGQQQNDGNTGGFPSASTPLGGPSTLPPRNEEVPNPEIPRLQNEIAAAKNAMNSASSVPTMTDEGTLGEYGYLRYNTITLPSHTVVQSVDVILGNTFAALQLEQRDNPTLQYMGGQDSKVRMTFWGHEDTVKALEELKSLTQRLSRDYRFVRAAKLPDIQDQNMNLYDSTVNKVGQQFSSHSGQQLEVGFLKLHNEIANLCGVSSVLIDDITFTPIPQAPGDFNIQVTFVDFDRFQKKHEQINRLKRQFEGDGLGMHLDVQADYLDADKQAEVSVEAHRSALIHNEVFDHLLYTMDLYQDLNLPTMATVNAWIQEIYTAYFNDDPVQFPLFPSAGGQHLQQTPAVFAAQLYTPPEDAPILLDVTRVDPDFYIATVGTPSYLLLQQLCEGQELMQSDDHGSGVYERQIGAFPASTPGGVAPENNFNGTGRIANGLDQSCVGSPYTNPKTGASVLADRLTKTAVSPNGMTTNDPNLVEHITTGRVSGNDSNQDTSIATPSDSQYVGDVTADEASYVAQIHKINSTVPEVDRVAIVKAVLRSSKTHNINANILFALIEKESTFNKKARNASGARGLGQLVGENKISDADWMDIDKNVEASAFYLRQMLTRFHENQRNALAAYNGGPGNYSLAETQGYAADVLRRYHHYAHIVPVTEKTLPLPSPPPTPTPPPPPPPPLDRTQYPSGYRSAGLGGFLNNFLTRPRTRTDLGNDILNIHKKTAEAQEEIDRCEVPSGMDSDNRGVSYSSAPLAAHFSDMIQYGCQGRMIRAFPTFWVVLIDGGRIMSSLILNDNFYGFNGVSSITVVKHREHAANLCVLEMSNVYGNLTNQTAQRALDESVRRHGLSEISYYISSLFSPPVDAVDLRRREQEVTGLYLQPGARLHVRMGYGSCPKALPIVFNGTIVEVPGGDGMIEVIAQGDGLELLNSLEGLPNQYSGSMYHGSEPQDLLGSILFARGAKPDNVTGGGLLQRFTTSIGRYTAAALPGFNPESPFGIHHFGNPFWQVTGERYGECMHNIYRSNDKGAFPSGLEDIKIPNIIDHFTEWLAFTDTLSWGQKEFSTPLEGKNVWDLCTLSAQVAPDYVCQVIPFGYRSTLFYGKPFYNYVYDYDIRQFTVYDDDDQQTPRIMGSAAKDWFSPASGEAVVRNMEDQFRIINSSADELGLGEIAKGLNYKYIIAWSILRDMHNNRKQCWPPLDPQLLAKYRLGLLRKPFQQVYGLTSVDDILANNIIASSEGMWTVVRGQFKCKSLRPGNKDANGLTTDLTLPVFADYTMFPAGRRTAVVDTQLYVGALDNMAQPMTNRDVHGNLPNNVATAILQNFMRLMYKGELSVIGQPAMKPCDVCVVDDVYNEMHGPIGVREVVQRCSSETGFVTTIEPDCLVSVVDERLLRNWTLYRHVCGAVALSRLSAYAKAEAGRANKYLNYADEAQTLEAVFEELGIAYTLHHEQVEQRNLVHAKLPIQPQQVGSRIAKVLAQEATQSTFTEGATLAQSELKQDKAGKAEAILQRLRDFRTLVSRQQQGELVAISDTEHERVYIPETFLAGMPFGKMLAIDASPSTEIEKLFHQKLTAHRKQLVGVLDPLPPVSVEPMLRTWHGPYQSARNPQSIGGPSGLQIMERAFWLLGTESHDGLLQQAVEILGLFEVDAALSWLARYRFYKSADTYQIQQYETFVRGQVEHFDATHVKIAAGMQQIKAWLAQDQAGSNQAALWVTQHLQVLDLEERRIADRNKDLLAAGYHVYLLKTGMIPMVPGWPMNLDLISSILDQAFTVRSVQRERHLARTSPSMNGDHAMKSTADYLLKEFPALWHPAIHTRLIQDSAVGNIVSSVPISAFVQWKVGSFIVRRIILGPGFLKAIYKNVNVLTKAAEAAKKVADLAKASAPYSWISTRSSVKYVVDFMKSSRTNLSLFITGAATGKHTGSYLRLIRSKFNALRITKSIKKTVAYARALKAGTTTIDLALDALPVVGWIKSAVEIAISIIVGNLVNILNRATRNLHAVQLLTLRKHGSEFSAGINGHQGLVYGDKPHPMQQVFNNLHGGPKSGIMDTVIGAAAMFVNVQFPYLPEMDPELQAEGERLEGLFNTRSFGEQYGKGYAALSSLGELGNLLSLMTQENT